MNKMNNMSDMDASHGHTHKNPTLGTHGMLLVGTETLYLSHLPMFMSPHNFQVLLEVTLDDEARRRLGDFQAHFGANRIYTFKPEDFPITDLVLRAPGKPLTSFKGDVFRGHFEKGGADIVEGAVVQVKNVIYFEKLGPGTTKSSQLEYLLFGKGKEFFLAHLITQPPDFDQVLAVNVTGHKVTDDEVLRGFHITFPGRPNTPHERVKSQEKLPGQGHITGAHQFLNLQVEVLAEIYFEEGELRKPATFDPTKEEKSAGFGD